MSQSILTQGEGAKRRKPARTVEQAIPYNALMIGKLLRAMPDHQLASATPRNFQMHPAPVAIRAAVIAEMISHERSRRV